MSPAGRAALAEAARTSRASCAALGLTNQHLVVNGVFTARRPPRRRWPAPSRRRARPPWRRCRRSLAGAAARRGRRCGPSTWSGCRPCVRLLSRCATAGDRPDARAPAPDLPGLERTDRRAGGRRARPDHGHGQGRRRQDDDRRRRGPRPGRARAERAPEHHRSGGPPGRDARGRGRRACASTGSTRRPRPSATSRRSWPPRARDLDEEGRDLLLEDLRSPCTEEVAVFHAFSRIVAEARSGFVVLDTAPTGHTLLLMDATGAYHRQMTRDLEPGVAGRRRRRR